VKVLLDCCVWGGAKGSLEAAGHDVVSVADRWDRDPGDAEVLALAHAEGRVLVTLDEDFGEVLVSHSESLVAGAIVTVEPDRIRVRDLR
jgi:predicted nuclease of predicted toxin-antitoxin system